MVLEGTLSPSLGPRGELAKWEEFEFKCKPGGVMRRPCLISPYHYRLDWLMWFAAFQVSVICTPGLQLASSYLVCVVVFFQHHLSHLHIPAFVFVFFLLLLLLLLLFLLFYLPSDYSFMHVSSTPVQCQINSLFSP